MVTANGLKLRCSLGHCKTLTVVTGAEVEVGAGEFVPLEGMAGGFAVEAAGPASPVVLVYEAEKICLAKDDSVIVAGMNVYRTDSTNLITSVSGDSGSWCGWALTDAGSADPEVLIDLRCPAVVPAAEMEP